MEKAPSIPPASTEIANVWSSYMNDSMAVCVLQHFLDKTEDAEVRSVLEYALQLAQKHMQTVTNLLHQEQAAIPQGFTDRDAAIKAPRLFTDIFYLYYIQNMGKIGMTVYSLALAHSFRQDIVAFYTECLESSAELFNRASRIMLSKGVMVRPPFIPLPKQTAFVQKQSFFTGWFGERRPLHAIEIANLYINMQRNILGASLLTGFSQTAQSTEVREFMVRGKKIAAKHSEIFGSVLTESELPASNTWSIQPTESTEPPFSDKLMMYHTVSLIASGIGHYGTGLATSTRRDLSTHYTRLTAEIVSYAEDGANIMINNGWMEEPPLAANRRELSQV